MYPKVLAVLHFNYMNTLYYTITDNPNLLFLYDAVNRLLLTVYTQLSS